MAKTNKESEVREALVAHFREQGETFWRQWLRQLRTTGAVKNLIRRGLENEARALYIAFVDGLKPGNDSKTAASAQSIAQPSSSAEEAGRGSGTRGRR